MKSGHEIQKKQIKKGTRVFNKGDMANSSSIGTVIEIMPGNVFVSPYAVIQYDEKRFEGDTLKGTYPIDRIDEDESARVTVLK